MGNSGASSAADCGGDSIKTVPQRVGFRFLPSVNVGAVHVPITRPRAPAVSVTGAPQFAHGLVATMRRAGLIVFVGETGAGAFMAGLFKQ